jgi:glycosyltransferase involved in cell wall biosynthesis
LKVALASCFYDPWERDPEAMLAAHPPMTGWPEAVIEAGASSVIVVQRFHRDALIRRAGVDYRFMNDGGPARAGPAFWGRRFTEVIAGLSPDVVHVDGLGFPLLVRHLRWRLPPASAIVVQDHGGAPAGSRLFGRGPWRAFHRFGLGAADGFLFTAEEQSAQWRRAGVVARHQPVHQILEASTDFPVSTGPAAGTPLSGRPALLWVGRLNANKDPLTVLGAFETAAATLPEAVLTLVYGDDLLLPQVRARIAESTRLQERVSLRARLDRAALPSLYASADLFVLGSHHEVACFSLLEALSFGVAPVVTDIPAFRVITGGGRIGALFPPGSVEGAARAISQVAARDPHESRRLVRDHFERELSWRAVGRRALAIYRAAAARRSTALPSGAGAAG